MFIKYYILCWLPFPSRPHSSTYRAYSLSLDPPHCMCIRGGHFCAAPGIPSPTLVEPQSHDISHDYTTRSLNTAPALLSFHLKTYLCRGSYSKDAIKREWRRINAIANRSENTG